MKVLHVRRPPWRHVWALMPAIATVGAGAALAVTGGQSVGDPVSDGGPRVSVPRDPVDQGVGFTLPPLPAPSGTEAPGQAATSLPPDTLANGIPAQALAAYERAAQLLGAADPECHVDWPLVAAIGKVESNHGRYAGNGLDAGGTVHPGIYGLPLDGSDGSSLVRDTDGGTLDRDPTYDRAVGPMQFIPGTWRRVGVDANGDGRKDPQNLADAATATAVYLCSGPGDLSHDGTLTGAILRYNHSMDYVAQVKAIARGYRTGYNVIPATPLPPSSYADAPYLPSRSVGASGRSDGAAAATPAGGSPPSAGPGPQSTSTGSTGAAGPAAAGGSSPSATSSGLDPVREAVTSAVASPNSSGTSTSPSPSQTCYINLLGVKVCKPL